MRKQEERELERRELEAMQIQDLSDSDSSGEEDDFDCFEDEVEVEENIDVEELE